MRSLRVRLLQWSIPLAAAGAVGVLALGDYFADNAYAFTPARGAPARHPSPAVAVFWSGDMGMRIGIGSDIVDRLADGGVPVLTVSSPVIFGSARDKRFAQRAIRNSLIQALLYARAERVTLVGFSFGADVLGAAAGEIEPALRRRIAGIVLVGPGSDVYFHANPFGISYLGQSEVDPVKTVSQLRGLPVTCVFGTAESDSLCRDRVLGHARLVGIPGGGHLMIGHRGELADAVVDAVRHPPAPMS